VAFQVPRISFTVLDLPGILLQMLEELTEKKMPESESIRALLAGRTVRFANHRIHAATRSKRIFSRPHSKEAELDEVRK